MLKRVVRKIERTPEQEQEIRRVREYYQTHKPTPAEALADSVEGRFVPLGVYISLRCLAVDLRKERERQQLTLAEVAQRAGMDALALSQLETGRSENPTLETLARVALALGKEVVCSLHDTNGATGPPAQ